jgi:regulator of replication initiation timing
VSTQKSRLSDEVDRLDENVNGLFAQLAQLKERVAELEEDLEEERKKRREAERKAKTALGAARSIDDGARTDGATPSKKKRAEHLSRNEIVRQALTTGGRGGSVTARKVKDMAKPQVQLYHKSISDAWDALESRWDELRVQDPEDKDKRLVVDVDDLTEELVGIVEEDLGRDDLTNRVHSGES